MNYNGYRYIWQQLFDTSYGRMPDSSVLLRDLFKHHDHARAEFEDRFDGEVVHGREGEEEFKG